MTLRRCRYTSNSTNFGLGLQHYQFFWPIERLGIGMCPLGCGHVPPTQHCIAGRIAAAVEYGTNEIDLWSLWDSTAKNWSVVEQAWRPWVKPLRDFLAGSDASTIRGSDTAAVCWNEARA
jgi:hypothetical protein